MSEAFQEYIAAVYTNTPQGLDASEIYTVEASGTLEVNGALLDEYLSRRRFKKDTVAVYRAAVKSWDELVAMPLSSALSRDALAWYRLADRRGLAASTLLEYAYSLRILVRFYWQLQGLPRLLACVKAVLIFKDVPFGDLIKEKRRKAEDRDVVVTQDEFGALMATAKHPRSRALLAVLADSSGRKGEILGLRVRDVALKGYGGELTVEGKTGVRVLPLVWSGWLLRKWLAVHPDPRPDAPLWAHVHGGRVVGLGPTAPNSLLTYLCEKAGLRHIRPGMLRHTKLTDYRRRGLPDAQFRKLGGWTPDSRMPARYEHLTGSEHVEPCREVQGVEAEPAE